MSRQEFVGDDQGYLEWLARHPDGFVINMERAHAPEYMLLHRASCFSISRYMGKAKPGGFTERQYVKVCADTIQELSVWVKENGRSDGSFSKRCGLCDPC